MRRYSPLVAVLFAAATAWFTVTLLHTTLGPAAALGVAALVVVGASAVFHRRLRVDRAYGGGDTPARRRAALMPVLLLGAAFAVLYAVGAVAAIVWGISASGSGGIGSVSAGISEAIVETVLAGIVAALVAGSVWAFSSGRSDRADRDDSK
jgi:hypothetical protein